MKNYYFLSLFCFLLGSIAIHGQNSSEKASYWFGGVNTQLGQKHNIFAYYGFSPDDKFTAAAVVPYFRITKNIHFAPSYMLLKTNNPDRYNPFQHHFMPNLTFQFKLGKKFILADRNMYFRVVMKDQQSTSFYRNRLGLTYLTKIGKTPAAFFINDAVFWNLRTGKFFRNRLGMGVSINVKKWLTPQFLYVLQNDSGFFPKHQFYFVLTVPLKNYGIFSKKKTPKHEEAPAPIEIKTPAPVVNDF